METPTAHIPIYCGTLLSKLSWKKGGGGSKGASRQGPSVSSWGPLGDEGKDGGRCEESPRQVATLRKPLLYQGDWKGSLILVAPYQVGVPTQANFCCGPERSWPPIPGPLTSLPALGIPNRYHEASLMPLTLHITSRPSRVSHHRGQHPLRCHKQTSELQSVIKPCALSYHNQLFNLPLFIRPTHDSTFRPKMETLQLLHRTWTPGPSQSLCGEPVLLPWDNRWPPPVCFQPSCPPLPHTCILLPGPQGVQPENPVTQVLNISRGLSLSCPSTAPSNAGGQARGLLAKASSCPGESSLCPSPLEHWLVEMPAFQVYRNVCVWVCLCVIIWACAWVYANQLMTRQAHGPSVWTIPGSALKPSGWQGCVTPPSAPHWLAVTTCEVLR